MKSILTIILAVMTIISAKASKYSYSFNNVPISEAIVTIGTDHPDLNLSFIYKELDAYRTSAKINTDDALEALRLIVGLNPVRVIRKADRFYVEALQHGKFRYTGRALGTDDEPVSAATVMILTPKDSVVITYGTTDQNGYFSIPCDRQNVIVKLTCMGYTPAYKNSETFDIGTVYMTQRPYQLHTVEVEAATATLLSDRSVYRPTQQQKNASQTAEDLISQMVIPQLSLSSPSKTASGQPVDFYIDFVPATSNELMGLRPDDVKYVEYYDYPADPRFQGNAHVINFVMQKYVYGGYVKGLYYDNFVMSRQLNAYAKTQYKKLTYDFAGGVFYMNNKKSYENTTETFRLPQEDGSIKEFERTSVVDKAKKRNDIYWSSFKALYQTDKVVMSNMVSVNFDHTPLDRTEGKVTYTPANYVSSDYSNESTRRVNSFSYTGYWYFALPHGNSLTINPYYAYSHTNQKSVYDELGLGAFTNGAIDDSHQANGDVSFVHAFGKFGTLKAMFQWNFLKNRTRYSGTSDVADMARTYRIGPGLNYSYSNDKVSGKIGAGLFWDQSKYGTTKENTSAPWIQLAVQYALDKKNSVSFDFFYRKSIPASSYRSAAVIQAYPLMSYTGNPALVPYNSFEIEGNYTLIPNNKYNLSAFGYTWIVGNRYVYDYEATPAGILRTIKQPMGRYAQWQYGLQGSARFFAKKLRIGLACYMMQTHNGEPYHWTKSQFITSLSAYYYLGNVYFGAGYNTPNGYPDGCMVGTWMTTRHSYNFQVGWSNKNWNLRFFTRNFLNYNTYASKGVMNSQFYDSERYIYIGSSNGFFQISATYTFGFGKKVRAENEAYQGSQASSGILK